MVEPETFLLTDDLRERSLILLQALGRLDLQILLLRLYVDLNLAFVAILHSLFSQYFAGPIVPEALRLQLLALEVEKPKRILLPRLGRYMQSKSHIHYRQVTSQLVSQ